MENIPRQFYTSLLGRHLKSAAGNVLRIVAVWLQPNTQGIYQIKALVERDPDGFISIISLPDPSFTTLE